MIGIYQSLKRYVQIFMIVDFLFVLTISCETSLSPKDSVQLSLEIKLLPSHKSNISALTTITKVIVIVSTGIYETENYKELVVKELTVSDRSAEGTISVPLGEDRTFRVRAYDASDFIQYHGNSKSMDITEKTFTVHIELAPIPPNRPTLSYDNPTGLFNWTKSTALDFASYQLYRSPDPGVTFSSDLIYATIAIDSAFYDDNDQLPEGDYYYKVYTIDTENLISDGSNEVRLDVVP